MNVAALLTDLRSRGIELTPEGEQLRYRAPRGALTPSDLAELRTRKAELLAELTHSSEPLPIEQLEADWRAALDRARAGFAAHSVTPTKPSLEAAGALEVWLAEGWDRWQREGQERHGEQRPPRWISEDAARQLLARIYSGTAARLTSSGQVVLTAVREQ